MRLIEKICLAGLCLCLYMTPALAWAAPQSAHAAKVHKTAPAKNLTVHSAPHGKKQEVAAHHRRHSVQAAKPTMIRPVKSFPVANRASQRPEKRNARRAQVKTPLKIGAAKRAEVHEANEEPVRRHPLSNRARLARLKKQALAAPPLETETPEVDAGIEAAPLRPLPLPAFTPRAARTEEADVPSPLRDAVSPLHDAVTPIRGSHESLVRQNEKSEAEGLERIEDDDDLNDRIAHKLLVPVPVSAALSINGNLPLNRRYCRPWTATFLADLARAHETEFHKAFEVSSAVRTVESQKQLILVNGNAAPAEGDIASPHLTGGTIDIAKQGMSRKELGWMRTTLLALQQAGMIDVEEEFRQACFHITVYKSYEPPEPEMRAVALHKSRTHKVKVRKAASHRPVLHKDETAEIASQGQ